MIDFFLENLYNIIIKLKKEKAKQFDIVEDIDNLNIKPNLNTNIKNINDNIYSKKEEIKNKVEIGPSVSISGNMNLNDYNNNPNSIIKQNRNKIPSLKSISNGSPKNNSKLSFKDIFNVKTSPIKQIEKSVNSVGAKVKDLPKSSYTIKNNYPETYGFIDDVGNYVKINKQEGLMELRHQSGNTIKIDAQGNTSINIKGTTKIIAEKDLALQVNGNADFIISKDLNITCKNLTTQTSNNTILNSGKNHTVNANVVKNNSSSSKLIMNSKVEIDSAVSNINSYVNISKGMKSSGNIESNGDIKCRGNIKTSNIKTNGNIEASGNITTSGKFIGDCDSC